MWYRTSAGGNGEPSFINDAGQTLAVTGTSPSFTLSLGTTVLNGGPYSTAGAAYAVLLSVIDASREGVIDPALL